MSECTATPMSAFLYIDDSEVEMMAMEIRQAAARRLGELISAGCDEIKCRTAYNYAVNIGKPAHFYSNKSSVVSCELTWMANFFNVSDAAYGHFKKMHALAFRKFHGVTPVVSGLSKSARASRKRSGRRLSNKSSK